LESKSPPAVYIPFAQLPNGLMALFNGFGGELSWMVRTSGADPYRSAAAIGEALHGATGMPVAQIKSMDDVSIDSTSVQRFDAWLMALFGVSALLLAALGVYGIVAYAVQERTREIGIRVALGASTPQIRRLVLSRGLALTAIGLIIGIGAALALTQLLSSMLFGVTPRDALSFAIVPGTLCAVAVAAAWLPARRATRVSPVIALRAE
jgi:ABC-type antimicrobial peptide transport system permease subunit